jgi:hypothetical protein
MDAIDAVRHDAASLYSFVDSISRDCERGIYPSYVRSSHDFFEYVLNLSKSIKLYLKGFLAGLDPQLAVQNPKDFLDQAQFIRSLRLNLFEFHGLIQPALDADTLHAPYALLEALKRRLASLPQFANIDFVVIHTSDVNYYQIGASDIRDLAKLIAQTVPGAPEFPKHLGVVGIPYSQSSGLFLNVALAHEMGHYVFQENHYGDVLSPEATKAILSATPASGNLGLGLAWCKDRVVRWCEEVFCDLFALWLIGPAFSFSYIELFAYSRVAPPLVGSKPPIFSQIKFYPTHPPAGLRLREHVRFMSHPSLDWWQEISAGQSHYISLLSDASNLNDSIFTFSDNRGGIERLALSGFYSMLNRVHDLARSAISGVPSCLGDFRRDKTLIQDVISVGIVPSRLVEEAASVRIPNTVSLVNAAYLFYLERLDDLIDQVDSTDRNCLHCRSHWSRNVESWTTKALEDVN